MCAKSVKMDLNNSLTDAHVVIFILLIIIECSSVLNLYEFLSCIYLVCVFICDDGLEKHVGPSSIIFGIPVSG